MSIRDFVVDPSLRPWKTLALDRGGEVRLQVYWDGARGGPEAVRACISEGYEVEPHFHLAAQFQLLLEGSMQFPTFRLDAPAVHYTDHNVPYGPFRVSGGHDMLVLHTQPGGVVLMRDRERRWQANVRGRELSRSAHEVAWEGDPRGVRRKVLFGGREGPAAEILEGPAGAEVGAMVSAFGHYEVVLRGSVWAGEKRLGPKGLRFVPGGKEVPPLRCGPEGAMVVVLVFDQDAARSYGGSTAEAIAERERR